MIAIEKSFLEVLADLEAQVRKDSDYEVIKVSLLLRHLLLDGLAHKAARRLQYRFEFSVTCNPARDPQPGKLEMAALDSPPLCAKSLEKFLETNLLVHNEWAYSVYDVIDACVHQRGGAHFREPKTAKAIAFAKLSSGLKLGFRNRVFDLQVALLIPVSDATLAAMAPLAQKIKSSASK